MRLLSSPASPFSAKVKLAAIHCDIDLEIVSTDTGQPATEFLEANPLGKIPTLLLDDGTAIYDSRVICDYLDRISGNSLVPQTDAEWLQAKRLESLADGVVDAAILIVYEGRFRDAANRDEGWVDRQWQKASRGLDRLEAEVGALPERLGIAHFAVAAALGWLDIRFQGKWDENRPALAAFLADFPARSPAFAKAMPQT